MKSGILRAFLLLVLALAWAPAATAGTCCRVHLLHFDAEVNPVTEHWLDREIRDSGDSYDLVVIELDTPGGLSESMRKIVKTELASRIPVVVWVAPGGARAASAGVWIGQAADVLAMAPETNIGSSTPINGNGQDIQKDLRRKVVNDAAASLRALAKSHGRNAAWADRAVREASNLTAQEALRMHVVDLIAPTLPALLHSLDGRKTTPKGFTIQTDHATVAEASPGFFTRLLSTLIDPNLISLLFLAGLAGLGYEVFHPGVVLPGALGAVSLVTALYGFSVLPFSWAGLALVLLGLALLVVDAHVVSHGALTVSGLTSLAVGMLMLFHDAPAPYRTSLPLVLAITLALGGFWAFALTKAVQVRRRPVTVGVHELVGSTGEVRRGLVFVRGELWQARPADGDPLAEGERVRVESVDGLVLTVRHVGAAASVS